METKETKLKVQRIEIIEEFIKLENKINEIISKKFFNDINKDFIFDFLIETSITFYVKVNVIDNIFNKLCGEKGNKKVIVKYSKKQFKSFIYKLRRIGSIRNIFAHEGLIVINEKGEIYIPEGAGKNIRNKMDFNALSNEFWEKISSVYEFIEEHDIFNVNREVKPVEISEYASNQSGEDKEAKGIPSSKSVIQVLNEYIWRTSVMFIFSRNIQFDMREKYCEDALKHFFAGVKYQKSGFGSNLIPCPDKTIQDKDWVVTRVHFYVYTLERIDVNKLEVSFEKYFKEISELNKDKSKLNIEVKDWVIVCERLIKRKIEETY